ncbi:hypothetical protein QBC37DRAFT_317662 [Rhypophila decipiens]|uniref:Rhodopsin domain-containing protein n=1 Tax=Rhypophila decipiens TaxID=261697 RepID=A0AAN6Y7I9_9PEZI|nr:hypothetical protein QBC37DRAFT_317662 [Rhypophila decipiens]
MSAPEGGPAPLPSNPDDNAGPLILAATLIVTTAALITYIARVYARIFVVRNAGLDDYFMTLAIGLAISGQGVIWGSIANGAGKHMGDVPPEQLGIGLKLNFVSQAIYLVALCVVKLSVGAMLARVAVLPIYRRIILGLMTFMTLWTITCLCTLVLQCTDIRAMWTPSIPMQCWSEDTLHGLSYSNVAISLFTDLSFALFIPVPMLWHLNVNRRTRLSLFGALGLGTFACAAAFAKIPSLVNYGKTGDWLWDSRDISIWTVVECNTGIVAANLPALRPLFRRLLGASSAGGSSHPHQNSRGPSGYYWRGKSTGGTTLNSKRDKTNKGNDGLDDESSSVRAINESYELGHRNLPPHEVRVYGSNNVEAMSSDDTIGGTPQAEKGQEKGNENRNAGPGGITMTMETSVRFDTASPSP